jgi:hypothetical protein
MPLLLALRNLLHRPWRTALLFLGYGLGVGVMIVLLSIGEAMIAQASDEKLVGGGEITVLPEGLDVEVMKTGGLGGLYFSIANARFVQLQLLAAPAPRGDVRAVAPQIEGKLLYLRTADGRELPCAPPARCRRRRARWGRHPALAAGAWEDDDGDRRWMAPTPAELRHDIDHFHEPPAELARRESWAEWHYFNVLSADGQRWAFVTLMVAGDVGREDSTGRPRWGGGVLVTLHETGRPARRFSGRVPSSQVRYSTRDADLTLGPWTVRVLPDGRYAVRASADAEDGRGDAVDVDLVVAPAPRAYFPGATIESGDFASGYAVAALRADADGTVCVRARAAARGTGACERHAGAQAYHDHNWGVWQGVTWEWGASRAGAYTLLYGRVQPPRLARRRVAALPLPRRLARLPRPLPPAHGALRRRAHRSPSAGAPCACRPPA